MPFEPWKQHIVSDGKCAYCGIEVPTAALTDMMGQKVTYSHHYADGRTVFSHNPAGRHAPCHSEK